ncbi:YkvA family protein [Micromonospora sp. C28SCA-DRY-2]|uniref:YkvA family protein n=1 Tax=Micromonospora sp. C28SCA-DRY-2 TaxID=3059522 RepID=UPI0026755B92|nr:YkvA family protein [Micromonospora sp. C28SCA-DRY-2]MDO3701480.1 YkvA family protein [Micromonospora sp. C28SCA-DRY-2]
MSSEAWLVVAVVGVLVAAMLTGAVLLAVRVVRARRMLGELGGGGKVAFYGALIYAIFPVDLLPDPIYLDDIGVLAGALIYLTRLISKRRAASRPLPGRPGPPPADPGRIRRPVS